MGFLPFLSGILLTLSFPKFSFGFLAWIALIPFFLSIRRAKSASQAIGYGLITGTVFYLSSLQWLTYVSIFGWIFLVMLEAAFFVLFAWLVFQANEIKNRFARVFWIALVWTMMEFLRSEIPIFGFGWNLIAYSQSDYLPIVQAANAIGAYGLGFVIAFVNACVFEMTQTRDYRPQTTDKRQKKFLVSSLKSSIFCFRSSVFSLLSLVFIFLFSHGYYHLNRSNAKAGSLRISLVQGNIPQRVKWEVIARDKILEIYSKLTELASYDHPDLILWPEASFPGYFNRDLARNQILDLIRKIGIPVLVGSPHFEEPNQAYNSAYLAEPDGTIKDRYDKQYLVPFGEYVPLRPIFGFLEPLAYSLGVSDFSAGRKPTIFHLMNDEISFSVLICFEDIFPSLAKKFVDKGADFLAVVTNDAWFGDSAAPYQHLQASIFRAVENGVPLVRAANTGISAFITSKGKVLDRVADNQGRDIFVAGKKTLEIPLEKYPTLYRKFGWIFPYFALGAFVIIGFIEKRR